MARVTAAEREIAAHRVDLLVDTRLGIAESHRMQSWDVERSAGELLGAFRDAHGYTPTPRVRWVTNPTRDGAFLLPRSWRN